MGSRRRTEDATTGTRQGVSGGRRVWRRTQGRESGSRRRAEVRQRQPPRDGEPAATGRGAATERFVCCGRCEGKHRNPRDGFWIVQVRDPSPSPSNVICPKVLLRPRSSEALSSYIQFISGPRSMDIRHHHPLPDLYY